MAARQLMNTSFVLDELEESELEFEDEGSDMKISEGEMEIETDNETSEDMLYY